ncbi:MAG TPA: hypothetical protein VHN14_29490 [Kofleriaceae bacterium]|nr:hypothetical protein [Kofleriaceae bacterium]
MFVAVLTAVAGCSDDSCGPGGAPDTGLVASGDAVTLTYGHLAAGLNNDCPASDAPPGVVSLTIHGTQSDGTGLVTLCVARPDLLAMQAQALDLDVAGAEVRIVDITGTTNTCSFAIDRSQPVTGRATSSGMCGNGSDTAGFALVLDGSLSITRTCGMTVDSLPIALHGRVAVTSN